MFRVGIIGPESTGKSTLARYLARRYGGVFVPEYARDYMERLAPSYAYNYDDVVQIAQEQIRQLAMQKEEEDVVFYDTELIITKVWFLHKYGKCPDFLLKAIEEYPMDVYLLCYPDMPWQPDPVRENPMIREYLFDWYEREIQTLGIPYYIIKHSK
jgi:NadR type nicotinamide-nucleotide adenylyltransferase